MKVHIAYETADDEQPEKELIAILKLLVSKMEDGIPLYDHSRPNRCLDQCELRDFEGVRRGRVRVFPPDL